MSVRLISREGNASLSIRLIEHQESTGYIRVTVVSSNNKKTPCLFEKD